MKTVILVGGGDAGGLIITEHGVRPIPPFDPSVRLALRSASAMVNAAANCKDESAARKMARQATSLSNLAVEVVEKVLGPLAADRAIVYQDDDGGFSCGSTGKPPIPIPWPPSPLPSVTDLLAAGVIETDLVDFLRQARERKLNFIDLFEKPQAVAKKLGITLSEKSANDLHVLAPSKLTAIKDPTDREIIGFFQKVAKDGRYLDTWYREPYEVSQALELSISERALERLVSGGGMAVRRRADDIGPYIAAGIAWAVVCIVIGTVLTPKYRAIDEIVKDHSGIEKF
jgi:hypothetical protein